MSAFLLTALWAAFVGLGAAHGFWRPFLALRGDAPGFAEAAAAMVDRDPVGNSVLALIEGGAVTATHAASAREPVDTRTVFQLASLSKWVAAWDVMALVEDGRLDLDAPVETYLTRWHLPPSEYDTGGGVTIRRLLSHTAGLTDDLGFIGFENLAAAQALEDSLSRAADPQPGADGIVQVCMRPDAGRRYWGRGFTLPQLVVEEVTGQSFADYMRERVLRPLGMRASGFTLTDIQAGRLAQSFDEDGTALLFRHYTALAAASPCSTADDMVRFVVAHGSGPNGEPVGRGVLSPSTVAAMRSVETRRFGLPI